MQNGLFKISSNQLFQSAINAVFTAVVFAVAGVVGTSGFDVFSADWGMILHLTVNTAFVTFVGFIVGHLTSTNTGAVFGAIPFEK